MSCGFRVSLRSESASSYSSADTQRSGLGAEVPSFTECSSSCRLLVNDYAMMPRWYHNGERHCHRNCTGGFAFARDLPCRYFEKLETSR
jgi:hypothetical protein